jgi:two-component sensor histidine kinase
MTAPHEIKGSALPCWPEVRVPLPGEPAAPPTHGWTCRSALSVEARPTAPRRARRHARKVISGWCLPDQADTVELVVSELVTNAIMAAEPAGPLGVSRVRLRLATDRTMILVEVWDENPGLPAPVQPDLEDESGRGLVLVAALCQRWGWQSCRDRQGKLVWALMET